MRAAGFVMGDGKQTKVADCPECKQPGRLVTLRWPAPDMRSVLQRVEAGCCTSGCSLYGRTFPLSVWNRGDV